MDLDRIDAKGTMRWCSVGMVKPNPGVCVGGTLIRIDDRAILFGGFTGRDPPESFSNTCWIINVRENVSGSAATNYRFMKGYFGRGSMSDAVPAPRRGHSVCVRTSASTGSDGMAVFGGWDISSTFADVFTLHKFSDESRPISGRTGPSAAREREASVVARGGARQEGDEKPKGKKTREEKLLALDRQQRVRVCLYRAVLGQLCSIAPAFVSLHLTSPPRHTSTKSHPPQNEQSTQSKRVTG